jgi:putative ABC transport system substrate-binding protein
MRRRDFIAGLGAAVWPLAVRAQQPAVPVIGFLGPAPGTVERILPSFAQGLAETGYVVGRNVTIESRVGGPGRQLALAADLVGRHVTLIVAAGLGAAQASKEATQTIPVVFNMAADPVEFGVVASLNRPSGNLTGFASFGSELAGKRLELLHKLVPAADPIALLSRRNAAGAEVRAMQSAARVLGVRLLVLFAATEGEVDTAFATLVEEHVGALVIGATAFAPAVYEKTISFAGRFAVPTMLFTALPFSDPVTAGAAGALASYGPPLRENYHQMGVYAGRILKGEKPSDLPIMQPTKLEFVINLKTAKALGLTIPETLLATADEVIQ